VQELAAVARVEAGFGLFELLGAEAPLGEGAERARGVVGEHARAAANFAGGDRGRLGVVETLKRFCLKQQIPVAREVRDRDWCFGDVEDERRCGQIAVLFLEREGEHHLARGALPFVGEAPVESGRGLRARLRDAGFLLRGDREKRVRARGERPGLVGEAAHPQAIEAQPRRLEHAEDLDWGSGRLGLEERFGAVALEEGKRFPEGKFFCNALKLRQFTQRFVQLRARLVLLGVERALAREAGGFEQRGEVPRPFGGRIGPASCDFKNLFQELAKKRRGLGGGDESCERDRLVEVLAQLRIQSRAPCELAVGVAEEGRANEVARAAECHAVVGELDEIERRRDQGIGVQGLAQGDVERHRRLCRSRKVVARLHDAGEDPHDFRAPPAQVGYDYADAKRSRGLTPIFESSSGPSCRGFDLMLRRGIGGAQAVAFDALGVAESKLKLFQKFPRLRRHHVEGVGNEELRRLQLREVLRHQIGQARGVDVVPRPAFVFLRPAAESQSVFIPGRHADAPLVHQAPGLAALRGRVLGQQEIRCADEVLPDELLLRRREEERQSLAEVRVQRVFPQPLDESAEGQDVGRFPYREILFCLESIELRHQRLGKALVRRDDGDARGVALLEAGEELGSC
jgi:hypothetical protein